MVRVVILLVHDFTEPKVRDLDLATHVALGEQYIARLQVIVDHGWFDLVQVLERGHYLHYDGACLALWDGLVLLQVEVQVVTIAVL